jgi:NAD(P)-dependent dehydrogenase (short-subunit alcohol dehydrogenase family)
MKLKDRVALVTGAGRGIGQATAINFAREGAHVAVVDIDVDNATQTSEEIRALGRNTIAIKTDVSSFTEVEHMVQLVREKLGDIDILMNNAGGHPPGSQPTLVCEKPETDWDAMIALNLKSVFNCCRMVIGRMIERKYGKIVSIASTAGILGIGRSAGYSAAKAGIIGFTMAFAKEVAQYGINVNCISPGPIATELFMKVSTEAEKTEYLKRIGFNQFGKPEDIAYMATFLASDDARYINGQNHAVCGLVNLGGPDI